jgi:hypothetical protein
LTKKLKFSKNEIIPVIQVHVFALSGKVSFHFDELFERTVDLNFHLQILTHKIKVSSKN